MNTMPIAFQVPKPVCSICAAAHHNAAAQTLYSIITLAPGAIFESACKDLCRPHWRCVVLAHNTRNGAQ
jgi:hypothetical protein